MKSLTLLLFLLCSVSLYGQDSTLVTTTFPSREAFLANQSSEHPVVLIQRKKSDIKMNGGHDFKIAAAEGDSLSKKDLAKNLWAIRYQDTLYLNGEILTAARGFVKAETSGRYLLLSSCIPGAKIRKQLEMKGPGNGMSELSVMFGMMGGAIGGAIGGAFVGAMGGTQSNKARIPLIYNPGTDELACFTKSFAEACADRFPELKESYELTYCDSWEPALIREFINDLNRLEAQLPSEPRVSEE